MLPLLFARTFPYDGDDHSETRGGLFRTLSLNVKHASKDNPLGPTSQVHTYYRNRQLVPNASHIERHRTIS